MTSTDNSSNLPRSLNDDGSPPVSCMDRPEDVRELVQGARKKDNEMRGWRRSRVKGLVDGNPPYKQADLQAAARADECNVNWRIAKYFLSLAKGMLYDMVTEAETLVTVGLANDGPQNDEWSQITTTGWDRILRRAPDEDFTIQQSQGQSALYGVGPIHFDDPYDWRAQSLEARQLLVPEDASSNVNKWSWAAVTVDYSPTTLYRFIRDTETATSMGWDVEATRKAIIHAQPRNDGSSTDSWEAHQDRLKTGSYYYNAKSKVIHTAHFYCREFPDATHPEGAISEMVVVLDGDTEQVGDKFLFRKLRCHEDWRQILHPMYWDHDVNGLHYAVTGLGVEMYAALEYENRLLCRLADDAFAPKVFFKPTTASERERMSIAQVGRYAILPAALEMVQQAVNPMLQDGMIVHREIQQLVSSNLSQYRSSALTKQQGNPVTARQIDYEASEQAKMGKTQLARIYEQYDWFRAEQFRRITSSSLHDSMRGGKEKKEFREWLKRHGVPWEALAKVESVKATRVVGQGSAYMRQQALAFLLGLLGTLPESGRQNLVRDVVASRAGQPMVERYAPRSENDPAVLAQQSDALQQVAAMKVGVPPVLVPTQNPAIYAQTFAQAIQGAVQAVQQGGDPVETLAFLQLAIPATQQHLARLAQDQSREPMVKQLTEILNEAQSVADKIEGELQAGAQAQGDAREQVSADMIKVQGKLANDRTKTQGQLALKAQQQQFNEALAAQRQQFDEALADMKTAAEIRRVAKESDAQLALAKEKAKAAPAKGKGKD